MNMPNGREKHDDFFCRSPGGGYLLKKKHSPSADQPISLDMRPIILGQPYICNARQQRSKTKAGDPCAKDLEGDFS